jgi:hypothetical protein
MKHGDDEVAMGHELMLMDEDPSDQSSCCGGRMVEE